jgi:hypothetical protein
MVQFADLTESELKLLCAVTTGEVAFCGASEGQWERHDNPAFADFWGFDRDVRAELIRWLCVNRDAVSLIDPKGIQIHAAEITGNLDLSFVSVQFPFYFLGCRIRGRMELRAAKIALLAFSGSLTGNIIGDGLIVGADLFLSNGFVAEGELRFPEVEIGATFDCRGATFRNPGGRALSADRAKIAGGTYLTEGFHAEGEVRLLGAQMGGHLNCAGGTFRKPGGNALNADFAHVAGNVSLENGFFVDGQVHLIGANIGGDLNCSRSEFFGDSGLDADRATVKGAFFWRNVSNPGGTSDNGPALNLSQGHSALSSMTRTVGLHQDDSGSTASSIFALPMDRSKRKSA